MHLDFYVLKIIHNGLEGGVFTYGREVGTR